MTYHYKMSADRIRKNLTKCLEREQAELQALQQVTINTKHKTLTNRAITGEGASIGDYLSNKKALYVSYSVNYSEGGISYEKANIDAYSYDDEYGNELGATDGLRNTRTITPVELKEILHHRILATQTVINDLKKQIDRVEEIANERNKLIEQIDQFNDSVSYASKARL